MKKLIILLIVCCGIQNAMAQAPKKFKKPVFLTISKEKIGRKWALAHPTVYDFNKDGKKDLIFGEFERKAKLKVVLNTGTDSDPVLTDDAFYVQNKDKEDIFVHTY